MEYYTFDKDGNYTGVTETEPKSINWTAKPYLDSFEQPKWDGEKWVESASWDKEVYAKKVNELFNEKFRELYKSKGYEDRPDVLLNCNHPIHEIEAKELCAWWAVNWEIAAKHLETADENSDAEEFIKSL